MDDTLFSNLISHDHLAIAVSGGSDSLALLFLVQDWAARHNKKITVLTVNHGLRKEATAEASYVKSLCHELHVDHHILLWQAEKPDTGLQEEARQARYDLMARFCVDNNITALLLGHTSDDQAETILMRLRRAPHHNRGLSGMAKETIYRVTEKGTVILARPLLFSSRSDLQGLLKKRQKVWIEDPSNENTNFERVRTRSFLEDQRKLSKWLVDFSALSARYRKVSGDAAASLATSCCQVQPSGVVSIKKDFFLQSAEPVQVLLLQTLISIVGGETYFQPYQKVLDIIKKNEKTTLGRVLFVPKKDMFLLLRERRNLPECQLLKRSGALWDNRFQIESNQLSNEAEICSGEKVQAKFVTDMDAFYDRYQFQLTNYDQLSLLTLPWLRINSLQKCDDVQHIKRFYPLPFIGHNALSIRRCLGPFELYCADFDQALCQAMQCLFTFSTFKK